MSYWLATSGNVSLGWRPCPGIPRTCGMKTISFGLSGKHAGSPCGLPFSHLHHQGLLKTENTIYSRGFQ